MDPTRFDTLVRALADAGTRRRLLGVMASVGLGGLLGQADDDATEARRKRHGRRKHGRNRGNRPGKKKANRKGQRQNDNDGGGLGEVPNCAEEGRQECANGDCCLHGANGRFCCDGPQGACCFLVDAEHPDGDPPNVCCDDGSCCPYGGSQLCAGGTCCTVDRACGQDEETWDLCCPEGQVCHNNACCTPNCTEKACGDDGCGGTCPNLCHGGESCCGTLCKNLVTDRNNCGTCSHTCARFQLCEASACCLEPLAEGCSATSPCCAPSQCRGTDDEAYCCLLDGEGTCYTDDDRCCGTCVPLDEQCTGHCPGRCSGTA